MGKGRDVGSLLAPLDKVDTQAYLGVGLHSLGLLGWILAQTGKADVYVSTFSTSEQFLRGFYNLRKKGLVNSAVLLADLKASNKTVKLYREMSLCFDTTFLGQNHSKVVLVHNRNYTVSVVTSQNQTYGDRAECSVVTTSAAIYKQLFDGLLDIINNKSFQLNGLFSKLAQRDRADGLADDTGSRDWYPIGY